jgi:hypothetical protein
MIWYRMDYRATFLGFFLKGLGLDRRVDLIEGIHHLKDYKNILDLSSGIFFTLSFS